MDATRLLAILNAAHDSNAAISEKIKDLEDAYQNGVNTKPTALELYEHSGFNPAVANAVIEPLVWQRSQPDETLLKAVRALALSLIELQPYNLEAWTTALSLEKMFKNDASTLSVLGEQAIANANLKIEEIRRIIS